MPPSLQDAFLDKHGVKLGFMSAFVKASADALQVCGTNGDSSTGDPTPCSGRQVESKLSQVFSTAAACLLLAESITWKLDHCTTSGNSLTSVPLSVHGRRCRP